MVRGRDAVHASQNSLMNCRHMPHGLAGGAISVATAMARISPFFAPCVLESQQESDCVAIHRSASGDEQRGDAHLHDRSAESYSLRTCTHGICSVLDVCALYDVAVGEEDGAADAEVGVGTY